MIKSKKYISMTEIGLDTLNNEENSSFEQLIVYFEENMSTVNMLYNTNLSTVYLRPKDMLNLAYTILHNYGTNAEKLLYGKGDKCD